MKDFKFLVLTDPHFFDTDLGCSGPVYDDFMHYEQKCFAETESINKSVFEFLEKADEADTVLIAGDLIFNGERKSSEELLKLIEENIDVLDETALLRAATLVKENDKKIALYKKAVDKVFKEETGHNVSGFKKPTGEVKRRIIFNGHPDGAWEWPVKYKLKYVGFDAHMIICFIGAFYILGIAIAKLAGAFAENEALANEVEAKIIAAM